MLLYSPWKILFSLPYTGWSKSRPVYWKRHMSSISKSNLDVLLQKAEASIVKAAFANCKPPTKKLVGFLWFNRCKLTFNRPFWLTERQGPTIINICSLWNFKGNSFTGVPQHYDLTLPRCHFFIQEARYKVNLPFSQHLWLFFISFRSGTSCIAQWKRRLLPRLRKQSKTSC